MKKNAFKEEGVKSLIPLADSKNMPILPVFVQGQTLECSLHTYLYFPQIWQYLSRLNEFKTHIEQKKFAWFVN